MVDLGLVTIIVMGFILVAVLFSMFVGMFQKCPVR